MEARHIDVNTYEVKLVLYFDAVNGNPNSKDTSIQVAAYQKSNNRLIDFFELPLTTDLAVPYTNPLCQQGNIKTRQWVYVDTIVFKDAKYTDPQGFYLAWERCCRNSSVRNIANPAQTGTVFYIELPPTNIPNFDSSPAFKPIIGDYGCVNRLFKLDFSATDADGDSLVYKLATPLAGSATEDNPTAFPSSAPYKFINWSASYSESVMIPGVLPLRIDPKLGELQVIASLPGLYAFAIVCEAYRNQIKIGEVRREFQLPVLVCPIKPGPHLSLENKLGRADTITYKSGTQFCTSFVVTDTVQATPLKFSILYPTGINRASASVSPSSYTVSDATDTSQVSFCISGYLKGRDKPYSYKVIVADDACSTPNTDTLTWYVKVKDTLLIKPKPIVNTPMPDSGFVSPNEPVVIEVVIRPPSSISGENPMGGIPIDSSCKAKIEVSVVGLALNDNVQIDVVDNKVVIKWIPDCKIAVDSTITFKVFVGDQECITPYRDSVLLTYKVKDQDMAQNKLIPNIITPNGDNINEEFAVSDYLVETCKGGFEKIHIYNRWGALVFQSSDYGFRWAASSIPDGLYYYAITYQKKGLNGWILVVR